MKELLKHEFEIECPGGGRGVKMRLEQILATSKIKTQKGEYLLKSSDKSKMKNHLSKMQREQDKFQKLMESLQKEFYQYYIELLKNSDVIIKK
jgi:hypothetical protein